MIIVSEITGKTYDDMDAVFYRNCIQSGWMLSHSDVNLLDLFTDSNMKLVFVFDKKSHRKYIGEWVERQKQNQELKSELNDNKGN